MTTCNLDCDFCEEFDDNSKRTNREIARFRGKFTLLATLGCFRDGYCLYMPLSHRKSFAYLDKQELVTIESELDIIRHKVSTEYSAFTIIAEHGAGINDGGASCCDHAHIHIIPTDEPKKVFTQFYMTHADLKILNSLSELTQYRDTAYIYLSCTSGQHFVWENTNLFGRQFVRRVCAEIDGVGPMFNWRLYPFYENMYRTANILRQRF